MIKANFIPFFLVQKEFEKNLKFQNVAPWKYDEEWALWK